VRPDHVGWGAPRRGVRSASSCSWSSCSWSSAWASSSSRSLPAALLPCPSRSYAAVSINCDRLVPVRDQLELSFFPRCRGPADALGVQGLHHHPPIPFGAGGCATSAWRADAVWKHVRNCGRKIRGSCAQAYLHPACALSMANTSTRAYTVFGYGISRRSCRSRRGLAQSLDSGGSGERSSWCRTPPRAVLGSAHPGAPRCQLLAQGRRFRSPLGKPFGGTLGEPRERGDVFFLMILRFFAEHASNFILGSPALHVCVVAFGLGFLGLLSANTSAWFASSV